MIKHVRNLAPELRAAINTIRRELATDELYFKAWQFTMSRTFHKKITEWAEAQGVSDSIMQDKEHTLSDVCLQAAAEYITKFIGDIKQEDERELLSPPGDHIKETMNELGIDLPLFVIKMGISAEGAKDLLDGKAPLTEAIARRLELTFNTDAQYWLNLETNYREKLQQLNT